MAKVIDGYMRDPEGNLYRPHSNAKTTDFSSEKMTATNAQDAIDELYEKISETGTGSNKYTDQKIAELVNSAPETMNTLKELSDAIEEHQDVTDALDAAITNKVDKVDGKGLSTNDFTDTYQSNVDGNTTARHTHSNMTVLNNTTASYTTEEKEKLSGIKEGAETTAATISGSNPTVTNSANAPLIYGKIKGYTEQKTLSGKNLLKITNPSQTTDGITFTVNEDGNITINGTATADTNFGVTDIANITGNGNIKRKLFQLNGSYTGTVEHMAYTYNWGHGFFVPIGEEGFLNTDVTYSIFRIKVSSGTVCNNLKVGFMVAEDVSEYEPFCGGIASPNPDYPQDIKGLGDSGTIEVKTCGKNLANPNNFITGKVVDYISGKILDNPSYSISGYIEIEPNTTYTKQGFTEGMENWVYDSNKNPISAIVANTFETPSNAKYVVLSYLNSNTSPRQLEEGTVVTPYEPYTETTATIPIDTLYEGDYLEVYADGSGKIVHKSGVGITNVYSSWCVNPYTTHENTSIFRGLVENLKNVTHCNKLRKNNNVFFADSECFGYTNGEFDYRISNERLGVTSESTETKCINAIKKYLTDNEFIFVGELKEPIETPLTAEQVQAFKQLYTFDNVTNFFCDGEITARYYVNTDSGDTVGMLQEQVKAIPDVYQKKTIELIKLGEWTAGGGASGSFSSVCYGNDKFVAVDMIGATYYSENGITWTAGSGAGSDYLKGVCYGNDKFVAVDNNTAYYSKDGITWTAGSGASGNFNSVCYGNDKFVAVGNSGATYYSEDGITWTAGSGASGHLMGVCYGNDKFVAVGMNGATYYSENGITWTAGSGASSDYLKGVCYGNDKFVAVDNNTAYYSKDGITWTDGGSVGSNFLNGVCYGNGKFVAVDDSGATYYSEFIKEQRNLEDVINELYKLLT